MEKEETVYRATHSRRLALLRSLLFFFPLAASIASASWIAASTPEVKNASVASVTSPETSTQTMSPTSSANETSGRASRAAEVLRSRGIPPLLITGLIAMVPIFELRGAIPVGVALFKLDTFAVFAVAVLFNIIPVLPILLFLSPIRRFLERKGFLRGFFGYVEKRAEKNRSLVESYEELGLALFVAVPLPATGAWTGALIAVILGLKTLKSFLFVALGVLGAGVVVTLFTVLGRIGIVAASALLLGAIAVYVLKLMRARGE
jgi:uncharacterized membrane protein